jgi:hypothetical protein
MQTSLTGEAIDHSTESDLQGRFSLENVEPGPYRWSLFKEGNSASGSGMIDVPRNPEYTLDLHLTRSVIEGIVVHKKESRPIAGACIMVWTLEGQFGIAAMANSDHDGRFRIEGLSAGSYEAMASFEGFAFARAKISLTADGTVSGLRLELAPAARVSIVATDASGNPVSGEAQISIRESGGGSSVRVVDLDARGAGQVKHLEPGEYEFELRAPGYRPASRSGIRLSEGENPPVFFVLEKE